MGIDALVPGCRAASTLTRKLTPLLFLHFPGLTTGFTSHLFLTGNSRKKYLGATHRVPQDTPPHFFSQKTPLISFPEKLLHGGQSLAARHAARSHHPTGARSPPAHGGRGVAARHPATPRPPCFPLPTHGGQRLAARHPATPRPSSRPLMEVNVSPRATRRHLDPHAFRPPTSNIQGGQ